MKIEKEVQNASSELHIRDGLASLSVVQFITRQYNATLLDDFIEGGQLKQRKNIQKNLTSLSSP